MGERTMFSVEDPLGNRVVEIVPEVDSDDLAKGAEIFERHLAAAVEETGLHPETIAAMWGVKLVLDRHRERIYREVAQERGVLAL